MLRLFLATSARALALVTREILPRRGARLSWRRLLVMAGFVPLFLVVQGIHWLGFALDEVFFRGYRRIRIREPLFVLGVPRSGTTHLHRVLAQDPQFTTFSTWECLFALSITERRFWLGFVRLDRLIGAPIARLATWIESHVFAGLDQIHPMQLGEPEEDYFALTAVLACFILILPFPGSELLWRMGRFDHDMSEHERNRLLDYYEGCLKRHLYVHGPDKRLLSKNAAFAPLAGSLAARFPDARFIACLRPPAETLPSQLSALRPGMRLFDVEAAMPDFRDRLLARLAFYYENLHRVLDSLPAQRCVILEMRSLGADLAATVHDAYRRLDLTASPTFQRRLLSAQEKARAYRSQHRYDAAMEGIDRALIEDRFGPIYDRFGFSANGARRPPAAIAGTSRAATELAS